MEDHQLELQLLPTQNTITSQSRASSWSTNSTKYLYSDVQYHSNIASPSLDLQLSNSSFQSVRPSENNNDHRGSTNSLKWQIANQNRMESMEKAYVERVREMTQREMELARSEMSCARHMWERAQEEVERAEKMKEKATRWIDSTCMEITCQACKQTFRP
uniref:protein indeterminate-domain 16-like n=1 Tax=Erigeron canadensis TaxID=72917 RepID=UPI001CB9AC6E|nr:protein indeterminate-domain 16-like [Erigeron canadensis]